VADASSLPDTDPSREPPFSWTLSIARDSPAMEHFRSADFWHTTRSQVPEL
jgi:hypothetical protein